MTQLRPEISDELWAQIRPARARGRWRISVAVIAVLVAALAAWVTGAFHPRAALEWNQSSSNDNLMTIHATIVNEGQLPLRVNKLWTDQPGVTLVASQLSDSAATSVPRGQQIGDFSLGGNQQRQLILYVQIDCAKITGPTKVEAAVRGPVLHRTESLTLADGGVLRSYCPGSRIADY